MQLPREIENSEIYKSVIELSKRKNKKVYFNRIEENDPNEKIGLGFTNVDDDKIYISIRHEALNNMDVYIHELLHAKQHLIGYPQLGKYSNISYHPYIDNCLQSLSNSLEHIYVYDEMKKSGYYQREINDQFITSAKQDIYRNFTGTQKIARVLNLFECSLRDPVAIEDIKEDLLKKQPEEYNTFLKIQQSLTNIDTLLDRKRAYSRVIKIISEYIKKLTGEDLYLNVFIRIAPPLFRKEQYDKNVLEILDPIKFDNFPHYFLLDKEDNQCSFFIKPNDDSFDLEKVKSILSQYTLREFIKTFF